MTNEFRTNASFNYLFWSVGTYVNSFIESFIYFPRYTHCVFAYSQCVCVCKKYYIYNPHCVSHIMCIYTDCHTVLKKQEF